jgi:hypothetical protein
VRIPQFSFTSAAAALVLIAACNSAETRFEVAPANTNVDSGMFVGEKANKGHVTLTRDAEGTTLTLSADFVTPGTPDPHWQIADAAGNAHLRERLAIKENGMNRTITVPDYVESIASVRIWCAFAEVKLGEASSSTRLPDRHRFDSRANLAAAERGQRFAAVCSHGLLLGRAGVGSSAPMRLPISARAHPCEVPSSRMERHARNVDARRSHRIPAGVVGFSFLGSLIASPRPCAASPASPVAGGQLTTLEREAGWDLLFDGSSLSGWHTFGTNAAPKIGWTVVDGCLHHAAGTGGGDLVSDKSFTDFELEFEWKVSAGANSGVVYRFSAKPGDPLAIGPQYEVIDDTRHVERLSPLALASALLGLYPPEPKAFTPLATFHRARIFVQGAHIEHWLNGVRTVKAEVGSEDWKARVAQSGYASIQNFGAPRASGIALQDHDEEVWFRKDDVWFRHMTVRDLANPPGIAVTLFDGKDLAGWRTLGDARYSADANTILGEIGGGGHSFLATQRTFGDFSFEVDVKNELPGNSGIQVRSHIDDKNKMSGYQIEIDPSARAWSGGLYDEGRRGWLQSLEKNEAGRTAFHSGEWNHYRIECLGPWIRAWVNGIPTADHLDPLDMEGVIALQVHSGKDTRVRWRNLELRDLGTRSWMPMFDGKTIEGWRAEGGGAIRGSFVENGHLDLYGMRTALRLIHDSWPADFCVRMRVKPIHRGFSVQFRAREPSGQRIEGTEDDRARDEEELATVAPGLLQSQRGWFLSSTDFAAEKLWHADDWNELVISAYGSRIAVHINGAQAIDVDQDRGPREGAFVIESNDATRVEIQSIELLGEPKH